jgi:hypothetical protein
VYWNILTMHGPINVKSPNNTSNWQMGFNSAFKGLNDRKKTVDWSFVVSSCDNIFGINTTIYFELALKLYYSFSASPSVQISVGSTIASWHKKVLVLRYDLFQHKTLSWLPSNNIHVVKIIKTPQN